MAAISRRILLQLATAGSTAAFLTPHATATAGASRPNLITSVETSPGAIDAYIAKTHFAGIATLPDIQAEYRSVIPIFPLVLPAKWSFPADPGLSAPDSDTLWERGNGVAAAYMIWQKAVATEAYERQKRGDSDQRDRHLDILEMAYSTEVRKAVIIDDGNVFIDGGKQSGSAAGTQSPLKAARGGDFAPMRAFLRMD